MPAKALDAIVGPLTMIFALSLFVGHFYWLWLSIQFGSFVMFMIGVFLPVVFVTGPIGIWSMFFGAPSWLSQLFG